MLSRLLPMHGAKTWFTEATLEAMLAVCESDHARAEYAHDQIFSMRSAPAPRGLVSFIPSIRTGLYERFNALFPEMGGATWFLRAIVPAANRQLSLAPTLQDRLATAVYEILGVTNDPSTE